jgi:hypothetical protein
MRRRWKKGVPAIKASARRNAIFDFAEVAIIRIERIVGFFV